MVWKAGVWVEPPREPVCPSAVRVLWAMARLHTLTGRGTITDVCEVTGLVRATVFHHLQSLERAGLAERYSRTPLWRPTVRVIAEDP